MLLWAADSAAWHSFSGCPRPSLAPPSFYCQFLFGVFFLPSIQFGYLLSFPFLASRRCHLHPHPSVCASPLPRFFRRASMCTTSYTTFFSSSHADDTRHLPVPISPIRRAFRCSPLRCEDLFHFSAAAWLPSSSMVSQVPHWLSTYSSPLLHLVATLKCTFF